MCQVQRGRKVLGRVPDRDQGLLPLAQEGGGQEERGHEEAHLACRGLRDPRRCQGWKYTFLFRVAVPVKI